MIVRPCGPNLCFHSTATPSLRYPDLSVKVSTGSIHIEASIWTMADDDKDLHADFPWNLKMTHI